MAKTLTVEGVDFLYPENRDAAGWGEEATAWAEAVTDVLANVSGPGDIAQTVATIQNDTAGGFLNVSGLVFDSTVVRGAIVEYSIRRATASNEEVETGTMYITYRPLAASFDIAIVGSESANVDLEITTVGQVRYKCSAIAGASYVGTMRFRARALVI